jgi:tetratricopeptide (TPR) repeat protein
MADGFNQLVEKNGGAATFRADTFKEVTLPTKPVGGEDLLSKLRNMANAAGQQQGSVPSGLMWADTLAGKPTVGVLSSFSGMESPAERAMREAQEQLAQGQYPEALELLRTVIDSLSAEHETSHEAHYLTAYCQLKLKQFEPAMTTLAMLRGRKPAPRLATRMKSLADQIRGPLAAAAVDPLIALANKDLPAATKRGQHLVAIDAESPIYYFLLGLMLAIQDQPQEAMRMVQAGLALDKPDCRADLESLRASIQRQLIKEDLIPVRQHFKSGRYKQARQYIGGRHSDTRESPFGQLLDTFLSECESGKRGGAAPADFRDREDLYRFLVDEEMNEALGRLRKDESPVSEAVLTRVVALVPYYPYSSFLYACSIYERLHQQIRQDKGPPLATAVRDLELALRYARQSVIDPEITSASALVDELQRMIKVFNEIQADVKLTDPLYERYNRTVDKIRSAGGVSHYQATVLREIANECMGLMPRLVTEEARKRVLGMALQILSALR